MGDGPTDDSQKKGSQLDQSSWQTSTQALSRYQTEEHAATGSGQAGSASYDRKDYKSPLLTQGDQTTSSSQQLELNDRVSSWMQTMSTNDQAKRSSSGVSSSAFTATTADPNTKAPSDVGSHYSGRSNPSRPPSPDYHDPYYIYGPGWVPPERQEQQERATQVAVSADSERHRRREQRRRDRNR
ncbi:hypothetical protein GGR54DRAFT_640153 [Hypoxylon sp. NC1633]|nr:hypothetical protein GGR54DRAFT_640153 [Hypoxylon sp. NC1633]